jgi:hypothetical protein
MSKRQPLSRRTFLRGTGVALGLPLLEAMCPRGGQAAELARPPKRAAFLYVPNGIIHDAWKPISAGTDYALPYSLEPLKPVKQDVLVLTGLSQLPYDKPGGVGHARPTTALLTGAVADKEKVRAGKSVDQFIADKHGGDTKLRSLELSIHGSSLGGRCDGEYSCVYSSVISWQSETSPMPTVNNPATVFQRLFGDMGGQTSARERSRREKLRLSVLDATLDDARRLHRTLGKSDQLKLNEYLYSLRELERRVALTAPLQAGEKPNLDVPKAPPRDYAEHVRLMGDLMVLAFQTDATRVCTFMLGTAAGGQTYPMLGIRDGHHELSHKLGNPDVRAQLRKIDRFNVSLFAYIVRRMKELSEGEDSLLDNTIVYYGSGLGNGGAHTPYDLPVLVAGRGAGTINSGRHIRSPMNTPLNNFWLSVLSAMDVPLERFGDSTEPLRGVLS